MQHSNQGTRVVIILAMAFVCFFHGGVARLAGQAATATMLGTVTDPSGAAVVGATIELTNTGTAATQTATSDSAGRYTLVQLSVGSYDVRASKEGFSNVVHRGITLTVGAQATVDFSLPIGQQAQTVTVKARLLRWK